MPFKVSEFKANVRDFARQYYFDLEITFPSVIGARSDKAGTNILVEATTIPGRTIEAIDIPFMGQQMKIGGMVTYDDWTVTYRMDDEYEVYKMFRAWSELVHGTESNLSAFPTQYKVSPKAYMLDAAGNKMNEVTLNGAWPSVIGEISLATGENAIQTVDITFSYHTLEYGRYFPDLSSRCTG